jgi:uncharacterized phage protein (TIGR02218 family)
MLTRSTATLNTWLARTKHMVSLWEITRVDGQVLRFTSHDHVINYPLVSGNDYTPAGGFDGTARRRVDGMKDHTVDFRGVIDSDFLDTDDLRAGKYREAKVTERIVDSRWPWMGELFSETWWVDQTSFDSEIWTAELSGPSRFLKRRIGGVFDRTCDRRLYNALCGVSRAAFTDTVTVIGTEDGEKKLVMYMDPATMTIQSDGWFDYGDVTFTSGNNTGLAQNVKAYRASDRRVELQGPMPFPILPGTTLDIAAGCDKLRTTCITKFSNINNNGGFGFMPGSDRVLQTPRR